MAKELRHKDPATKLSRTEDNALDRHYMTGGAANDIPVYDATNAKLVGKTLAEIRSILNVEDGATAATKEFFAPVTHATDMDQVSALACGYINATGEAAWMVFHISHDFSSITEAVVLIMPLTTATHRFDISSNYAANSEAYNTHSESDLNHDFSLTANQFYEVDVSGVLSSPSAGDYGGIMLKGDATNTPNAIVIGFRLKYA